MTTPFMPLYVADYLADAAHLSTIEHGAYLLLLMNYWQRGKPLPDSDSKLSRIARLTPSEWDGMRDVLEEFFDVEDGSWIHKRVEAELDIIREKSTKAREAGKASAAARERSRVEEAKEKVSKRRAKGEQKPDAAPAPADLLNNEQEAPVEHPSNDCSTDVEQPSNHYIRLDYNTPPTPRGGRKRAAKDWRENPEFVEWWTCWKTEPKNPNDPGPAAAYGAWLKAVDRAGGAEPVLNGARVAKGLYASHSTPPDKVPHSTTWLRGNRWSAFEGEEASSGSEEERPSNLMVRQQRDYPPEIIDRLREIKRASGLDAADEFARQHLEPVG